MNTNIDKQDIAQYLEGQAYEIHKIQTLIDITRDAVQVINNQIFDYHHDQCTSDDVIYELENTAPKITTLLGMVSESSGTVKDEIYTLALDEIKKYNGGE